TPRSDVRPTSFGVKLRGGHHAAVTRPSFHGAGTTWPRRSGPHGGVVDVPDERVEPPIRSRRAAGEAAAGGAGWAGRPPASGGSYSVAEFHPRADGGASGVHGAGPACFGAGPGPQGVRGCSSGQSSTRVARSTVTALPARRTRSSATRTRTKPPRAEAW